MKQLMSEVLRLLFVTTMMMKGEAEERASTPHPSMDCMRMMVMMLYYCFASVVKMMMTQLLLRTWA